MKSGGWAPRDYRARRYWVSDEDHKKTLDARADLERAALARKQQREKQCARPATSEYFLGLFELFGCSAEDAAAAERRQAEMMGEADEVRQRLETEREYQLKLHTKMIDDTRRKREAEERVYQRSLSPASLCQRQAEMVWLDDLCRQARDAWERTLINKPKECLALGDDVSSPIGMYSPGCPKSAPRDTLTLPRTHNPRNTEGGIPRDIRRRPGAHSSNARSSTHTTDNM